MTIYDHILREIRPSFSASKFHQKWDDGNNDSGKYDKNKNKTKTVISLGIHTRDSAVASYYSKA